MINRIENLPRILAVLADRAGEIRVMPFYSRPNTNAIRVLLTAQKDSKAPLAILPPFFAYGEDSLPSKAAESVLRDGKLFFDH
jgi:tRNA1(Val) A37 N6-methylase TrmN6